MFASAAIGVLGAPMAAQAQAQAAASEEARSFDVAPQSVVDALAAFGRQSGLQVSVEASEVRGLSTQGVRGTMTPSQALDRLLASTGLVGRIADGIVSVRRISTGAADPDASGSVVLGPLRVEGVTTTAGETGAQQDARGHDEVYDLDVSSSFAGKEEVERYKGVNTADVLKGMVNVFSGDARNGGALDPSIRGVQGPGRVPVIIDGTEQALTVWRGYNGASNRSYVDPSLISDVQVLKGPVSIRGVNGSTGGAVVINTLDADDILKPDETFGVEFRLEGGNNSTNPRLPTLLTGQDYRDVPGFTDGGIGPTYPYGDPSLRINLRTEDDNEAFSFGDRAIRIAAAGRIGDFDLFGAYAFRERGNYFSGTTAPDYYQQEELPANLSDNYVRRLGLNYEPGNEVPNTSSELESFLLKATWRIAPDQYLQLGFRDSRTKFGEIMPTRIFSGSVDSFGNVQWPLSKVHAQAYNTEYKWQPESRWIDLEANLWATDTVSDTYSAGGFPNSASEEDPIIINSAVSNADNDRYGFTASNRFSPTAALDFLLEGSWQHEKLRSDDQYTDAVANGWRQYPRAGRREEYRISFSGEWRPASFLKLSAGLTYSGYWAKDDFLPELLEYRGGSITQSVTPSFDTEYATSEFGAEAYEAYLRERYASTGATQEQIDRIVARNLERYIANPTPFEVQHTGIWEPDADGNFRRADNPCLNGSLDSLENYIDESCVVSANNVAVSVTEAKRRSGHGWAPTASATVYLSGGSRAYLRYAQAYRFPSMFESTIGFSASLNPLADLKPERIHSWEAAFIQDLRPLFHLNGEHQHADLKLTWYHNTTHDVIERDTNLQFSNLDKQVIAGFELQARYDNGGFFTDLSAGHMTTNKACDESVAATLDPSRGRVPDCVKYGFLASFLLTQAIPEDSVNWTIGGRFLDRRLEVGGRLTWYSEYDNPQLDEFTDPDDCVGGCVLNIPFTWDEILTFDAYAKFRISERFSAELTGLNLTNRYYLDPLSRSLLPAPGRTVRLSLTGKF
ncbi:TonB-dependent receptor [Pelagerythrobacter aerophilus]|nr:TonB-dependent receptor [Pelagerythrobacter aerophilus]